HLGDFYELFDADAEVAARVLGLTLTSRDKADKTPMAGFPHDALESYLQRLLHAGHRVAICDQVEDPALAKGLLRPEGTRALTPGTVTEADLLARRGATPPAALGPRGRAAGRAGVELSTGQFLAAAPPGTRLADELARLPPAECLCAEKDAARLGDGVRTAAPA